ncbi:MAG: glycosyltransferase [Planctomycetota bacterium]
MIGRLLRTLAAPLLLAGCAVLVAAISWPLLALVLALDLLAWPFVQLLRRRWQPASRDVSAASIVTVSWNGRHFLEVLLPSLRRAVEEHGGDHEVIVVDNGSTDGTVEWLAQEHPWVRVVALPENRYFVRGNLAGVEVATRDVLVFLNNDMEVRPGFLGPLLDGLRDPGVFGVAAEVFFRDGERRREETGRTRGEVRNGWLKLAHVEPLRDERELDYVPTLWAGGGSAAFDRRMYLALGGFDTLYDPFYMEDMGLSYQAWRRGWRVLFTARSQVVHEHRGTSRKAFGDDYIDNVIRRNQHLFLWRNVTDPLRLGSVLLLQPLALLARGKRPGRTLAGGLGFELRALLRALPRLPEALWKRCASRRHYRWSDGRVLAAANSIAAHRVICGRDLGGLDVPTVGGLRVLVLSARLPRLGHDGSWVLWRRLEAMARRHRVTLFAFLDDEAEAAHAAPLRRLGIEVVTAVRERNPMPGNLHHGVPARLFRDYSAPRMRAAVRRMLEGTDHDLVQVEYVEMAHLVAAEPRVAPRLYVCHESLAVAARRQERGLRGLLRAAQAARLERRLVRSFDRTVALSDRDAAALRLLAGVDVAAVPSGIELRDSAEDLRAVVAPVIAFVGYFKHAPNVDAALWLVREILPLVRAAVPDARVRLIGREAPASVAALARPGEVEVAGFVPDLDAALQRAAVVALPLRAGGGLRGKLLEALAVQAAVVATPIAIEGVAARHDQHCLVAADAAEFAAAIVRLLRDPDLRYRLGSSGRLLVRDRYSVGAAAAAFDRVHLDLVHDGARAGDRRRA